jgi:hypothetical protein
MSELYWSKDKPTQEGWYWYIEMVGVGIALMSIVQVIDVAEDDDDKVLIVFKGGEEVYLKEMNGNWAGPLVPPTL